MGNKQGKEEGTGATGSPLRTQKKGVGLNFKTAPSASAIQKHIENAQKSRVLQLKNCNFKQFPDQTAKVCTILRSLDFSHNRIRILPTYISTFTTLKHLHLSSNELVEVPDEIGSLKKLEALSLDNNQLHFLPDSFACLNSLSTVNLAGNKFTVFPIALCHLVSLDNLDISSNLMETLPDEVKDLTISELNLNQNRLSSLNANLANCKRLRTLRVEENCLKKNDFPYELLANSNVSLIAYAGNLFQDKDFQDQPGYDEYQSRYTATKRKM